MTSDPLPLLVGCLYSSKNCYLCLFSTCYLCYYSIHLINQQVVLESRFRVAALYARRKAAVCRFDVAIAMVNTDDVNSVFVFHLIFLSKFRFLRIYLTSPPCALDSSDARQRIGSMGVPPLRFRPALSRSIIVLPPPSSPCRLLSGSGGSC